METGETGDNGVLPTVGSWSATVPGKTLWILVGHGKPSHVVSWSGVYSSGKGEKGDKGDGVGYYVYFKYCEKGTSCTKPSVSIINAKGVLDKPTDWGLTPEEAAETLATALGQPVDGYVVPSHYVLWFLFGSGRAKNNVRWISFFPTKGQKGETGATGATGDKGEKGDKGDKGEQGDTGDTGDKGEQGETGDKGDKGEQGETGDKGETGDTGVAGRDGGDGQDGLGQYILYANLDDGTEPVLDDIDTPIIGSDGVLPAVTDWSVSVLDSKAGETLWALVGYGEAGSSIIWAGFYPPSKGEKGDKGDGVGYYVYFRYCEEGKSCTKPPTTGINAKGVLTIPIGWKQTPEAAAVVLAGELSQRVDGFVVPSNYVLWFLFGSGKAKTRIKWISLFPTRGQKGDKGDKGNDAVGALEDRAVTTSKIVDGAVTKGKLGTDVLTVARADIYRPGRNVDNTNNTFLSAKNGQNNTTGDNLTAMGSGALQFNTTGDSHTAMGSGALYSNTTSTGNTAVGSGALGGTTGQGTITLQLGLVLHIEAPQVITTPQLVLGP